MRQGLQCSEWGKPVPGLEPTKLSEPMWTPFFELHAGPWRTTGHDKRPDTRPIEAPRRNVAEKITLPNRGQWYGPRPWSRVECQTVNGRTGDIHANRPYRPRSREICFHLHGVDERGKVVLRKTLRRPDVAPFFANLPPCVVGMEASNGAHYWAKTLSELGHDVRLISPQFVTPYVKSNKNDRNDAEAICEAVGRPNMRFVPVKSAEQLAIQAIHRIRSRLVANRVRLVNQIRGLLGEHGVVNAQAIGNLRRALPRIVQGCSTLCALV